MSLAIGIVGAGIGGLTAALALEQCGFDVEIFEAAPRLEALGAGIQLSPNATKVLRALRVLDAVAELGVAPDAVHFRSYRTGYLIASRPLGPVSEARYGAPYLHVHRGDLQNALAGAVSARSIALHTGVDIKSIEDSDQQVVVAGRRFDVLVGCDGIHSTVRHHLFGSESARFTGQLAWRALVPVQRIDQSAVPRAATVWLGPNHHFVHYYVASGELLNLVGVVETEREGAESWRLEGDISEFRADFEGWHPHVTMLIDAATHCHQWGLYDRAPMQAWGRGRITLLGDACHPMLPFLAQGAAMAIEDAWVLSRCLEDWEDGDPAEGLREYERYRMPRTARVQQSATAQGKMFHEPRPLARAMRNLKLGLATRLLPEIAMEQLDWLHGYDAVQGFG